MSENTLVFEGTRWLSTRIVGTVPWPVPIAAYAVDYKPCPPTIFRIAASGNGRRWSATQPEGFWRDFVELDLGNPDAVVQFLRRRGDPAGLLADGYSETNTARWYALGYQLNMVARAYEPESADGISRFDTTPAAIKTAEALFKFGDSDPLKEIEPVLDPSGRPRVVLRTKTLAAFMVLSAASAIEHRTPMRRCTHCTSWFHLGRHDAQFCSGSCRAASFNASKGDTDGKHPKEKQSERPSNLAKPVARAGAKRKRPPADKKLPERKGRKGPRSKGRTGNRAPRRR